MPRVLIAQPILHQVDGRYREILVEGGFDVLYPPKGLSLKQSPVLVQQLHGIDAVVASTEQYAREVLSASSLRVIARTGVGYDSVDIQAAADLGIAVTNTPGANREAVAEHVVAMMLAVAHGFPARDKEIRGGVWRRELLPRLAGKTVGLVGLGAIGKTVALHSTALGMRVIAHDPAPDRQFAAQHAVPLCSLEELFAEADVVSLHLPCTPKTANLINARTLNKMKRGAILINTARGGLVDEDALVDALRAGHLAAAALDVFKVEPLPTDSPLTQLDSVLLCPHVSGTDEESMALMAEMAADSIVELYRGGWPEGRVVNEAIRPGWKW